MNRAWISLVALVAVGAMAQKADVQSGTPAMLEGSTGKKAPVFLQSLKDGRLIFQPRKSTKNIPAPVSKIRSLTFFPKYDAEAVELQFNSGDYAGALAALVPVMEPYNEYMLIENNLRDTYCMQMDAYRKTGDLANARKAAMVLMETGTTNLMQRGQVTLALLAISGEDLETAKKIRNEVTSVPAGLYLQACIERAEDRPKDAIWTVSGIIINHANEVEWLGPSELLCAHLYLDMLTTNSVITTNSPMNTARQVKNIYGGSSVAADAEKIWISLGGAKVEAALAAEKAERERIETEEREKQEAEQKEREAERLAAEEAEKKAKEEAEAALLEASQDGTNGNASAESAADTNVTTNTEMESE